MCFKHFFPKINSNLSSSLETRGEGRDKGIEAEDGLSCLLPEPVHRPMVVVSECFQQALLHSLSWLEGVAGVVGGSGRILELLLRFSSLVVLFWAIQVFENLKKKVPSNLAYNSRLRTSHLDRREKSM